MHSSPTSGSERKNSDSSKFLSDKPFDIRIRKKTSKGKVDVTDIKKSVNFANDPSINHITCNQTQEYFAVATNIGFEIIQNDSSSDRLKKKC